MFLKKFLNQPNLVGSMLIALMVCGGFVYAVGFDGFNVQTATGDEVEAWLAAASGGTSGGNSCSCGFENCPGSNCSDCTENGVGCDIVCKICSCPILCSNFRKFSCQTQFLPNGGRACVKNSP